GPAHAGAVTARAARARQSGSMHQAHEGGPPFTTGRWVAMIIPPHMLSPEALHRVIEAFVTREGTDYGEHAIPLTTKVVQVRQQLDVGTAVIVYDQETESRTLQPSCRGTVHLSLSRFAAGAHAGAALSAPGAPPASAAERPYPEQCQALSQRQRPKPSMTVW